MTGFDDFSFAGIVTLIYSFVFFCKSGFIRFHVYIGGTGGDRDFRHQKLLKHPQNPYSIERA